MLSPIGQVVQRGDPERFVTVLFAPAARREALFTLYAFNTELARARAVVSTPMLALIRLQWWREVVEGAPRAHEVAGPLHAALAAGLLRRDVLLAMIAGREQEADDGIDAAGLATYLHDTAGLLMQEAGHVLTGAAEPALLARGIGCGAAGLLRNAPAHRAQGRWTGQAVADLAAVARVGLGHPRRWPAPLVPAVLPCVMARRALRGHGYGTAALLSILAAALTRRS